jgi:AraC family transcriptional regulator of adaptative response/methylated-DNA-[protein]-cysteine methyltransferase
MSVQQSLPAFETMYRAMVERDVAFDGLFFVCVPTTGVFCRPTCPARKPLRRNVEFVATVEQAWNAGYRPCLRCKPLEAAESHPAWVVELLSKMRASRERLTDRGLRGEGLSPSQVRSYFRRRFGVTFQGFQRAERMSDAFQRLNAGQTILGAGLDSGYESHSGFRGAFAAEFGVPPGRAARLRCLVAAEITTPLRPMLAIASARGICLLEFLDRRALATELRDLRARLKLPITPGSNQHLDQVRKELAEYFRGTLRRFDVPLDLGGTAFERDIWSRLVEIPFGHTASYSQLATEAGKPGAARAVGHANGKNPIAIVVPCHRVVGSDGSLQGYGGGLWRKRWLLQHEQDMAQEVERPSLMYPLIHGTTFSDLPQPTTRNDAADQPAARPASVRRGKKQKIQQT